MILNSWKEIAAHLRCSVRTAQRLEQEGMPVRRPAGHSRSAVIAFSDEIDTWLAGSRVNSDVLPFNSERGKLVRAEIVALRARMAECRERSTAIRQRSVALRARLPFSDPLTSLNR